MKLKGAASLLLALVIAAGTGAVAAPGTGDYFNLTVKNLRRPVLAQRIGTGPKRTYRAAR